MIPSGVVSVTGCLIERCPDANKPFSFQIIDTTNLLTVSSFYASIDEDFDRWITKLNLVSKKISPNNLWLSVFKFELATPAGHIVDAECSGFVGVKLSNDEGVSFPDRRWYCFLKDGVFYFYQKIDAPCSIGALLLHNYKIMNEADDCSAILISSLPKSQPTLVLNFNSASEKYRWTSAIHNSLQLWMNLEDFN